MTRTPLKDQHARVPVDRTAALVTQPGVHADLDAPSANPWDSELPIATQSAPPQIEDLKGRAFGRLTVVGYHSQRPSNRGYAHFWVVRCACGMYSVRRGVTIRRAKNPDECCTRCDYLKTIRLRIRNRIPKR